MAETWWSAAPLALRPEADVASAVVGLAQSLLWGGPSAPIGLLVCVLGPGLDGLAAQAALAEALPGAPIVVLQASGVIVGGELLRGGVGLLLGQWEGAPAAVQRGAPVGDGLWLVFSEEPLPAGPAVAAAVSPGLLAPMGPGGPVWVRLPPLIEAELRLERSAEPVGPLLRVGRVSGGQIGALDGEVAAKALSALGARLPEAERARLRERPLLLAADGPAWAVGGLAPRARVLGVHEGEGALLVDRPVREGAAVQLGAARQRSLSSQLSARGLRAEGLRLALLLSPAGSGEEPDPALNDELAALQLVLGAPLLFGLLVEAQGLGGQGGAAMLSDCDVLVALREPPWD